MALIEEWGPDMWKLLHSYAEYAGHLKSEIAMVDEIRAWKSFLLFTEEVLPCSKCKSHMKEWRRANPIEDLMIHRGPFFKDKLRRWLWGLHEAVNERRGPETTRLPYESLAETYKTSSLQSLGPLVEKLTEKLEKGVLYRQVEAPYLRDWRRSVLYVTRFMT